jgi:uncharacterized protein (TIGR03067 family)
VPEAPSATSGLAALQGEWLVLSEEWKGKPLGDAVTQRQGKYLHFDGDRMTFTRNGPEGKMTSQGKIRVEGGAFEFSGLDYFGKPRELRGIFALTGDTLRLAYPNTNKGLIRPTAFESTAMDDTLVIVAKRKPADIAQKPIDPDRAPKSIAVPQIVQHKTFSWDKSKTNYARYEDRVFDVGLGNEAPGWGTGVAGVELENVRHLQLSVTFSGKFKYMDVNSLAGFLIDYGTGAGYTKRVSLHTGISDRKHFASWPNWGKGKAPDTYISVGTQKTYDIDFQTWAPTGWDGRVWFSAIVSNTGDRTRIVARITGME